VGVAVQGGRASELPRFTRRLLSGAEPVTAIGTGALGGKAAGLLGAREWLRQALPDDLSHLSVSIPRMVVIATDLFDAFVERNRLLRVAGRDERAVARAFVSAPLPVEIAGDLWDLVREVRVPLAIRSSSLLEDALAHPFAGVYTTKMIPNHAPDPERRFRVLAEAIKLVWASALFPSATTYVRAAGREPAEEKMAVIVQEVVGRRHGPRFYPDVSAVARSWNFYPQGAARREEGVVDLALGLGKTIVDGGRCWTYSPAHPHAPAPFGSPHELLEHTQTAFWTVNMGPPPPYDPLSEVEHLTRCGLAEGERDMTLRHTCSTYDARSDRLVPGTGPAGPRALTFAPLLDGPWWPFNESVRALLDEAAARAGAAVEIELAATVPERTEEPLRLGFLQVRPMASPGGEVEIGEERLQAPGVVVASEQALGQGVYGGLRDLVFVAPDTFDVRHTRTIAAEVRELAGALREQGRPFVLVGFGRWGSADPWLGIPVRWEDIVGVRALVEASFPSLSAEMSQGAHFFHNLLSFRVAYFSVPAGTGRLDWPWLQALPVRRALRFTRHAESPVPLSVQVDGRHGRGVILREPTA